MTIRPLNVANESHSVENPAGLRILIVEDEVRLSRFIGMVLQHAGYRTLACKSVAEARQILMQQQGWALVLTDLIMPHENGFELVHWLMQNRSNLPVVIMTAYLNKSIEIKAAQMGVCAVLLKPFTLDVLRDTVEAHAAHISSRPHVRHSS